MRQRRQSFHVITYNVQEIVKNAVGQVTSPMQRHMLMYIQKVPLLLKAS